jgi:short-subunit dehydrogenase
MSVPTQGTYNASKFAVRGYTEALRMELELEGAPVSATCVHPGGIATNIALAGKIDPALEKATGVSADTQRRRANKLINVTTAESAALQILGAVEKNARRVLVGPDARMLDKVVRLLGSWYQPLVMRQLKRMNAKSRQSDSSTARA